MIANRSYFLIHEADPHSRPAVITIFALGVCPYVPTFPNLTKQGNFQVRIVIAFGGAWVWPRGSLMALMSGFSVGWSFVRLCVHSAWPRIRDDRGIGTGSRLFQVSCSHRSQTLQRLVRHWANLLQARAISVGWILLQEGVEHKPAESSFNVSCGCRKYPFFTR